MSDATRFCHYHQDYYRTVFKLEIRASNKEVLEDLQKRFPDLAGATITLKGRQFELIRECLTPAQDRELTEGLQREAGVKHEGEGIDVMLELLEWSNTPVKEEGTTEEQRAAWIIECLEKRPDLMERISKLGIQKLLSQFNIQNPKEIAAILLACSTLDPQVAMNGLVGRESSMSHELILNICFACARTQPQGLAGQHAVMQKLSPEERLQVALACAKTSGNDTINCISTFNLDEIEVAEVARVCLEHPSTTLRIQAVAVRYLRDPQKCFEIAKRCAENSPHASATTLLPYFVKSGGLDREQCDAIAKICIFHRSIQIKGIVAASKYLLDPQERFKIAKRCAEVFPEATATSLSDFESCGLDPQQCVAIARICIAHPDIRVKGLETAATYILDPQERLKIAERGLKLDHDFPIESLVASEEEAWRLDVGDVSKYEDLSDSSLFISLLRDEQKRDKSLPGELIPLAQQYARKHPAELCRLLANCPLPDDTLKEVLPLCIPQACEQVLENLTKIQMGNVTCYEMALKCAQENPQLTARYIDRLALTEPQQLELRKLCVLMLQQYARENPTELLRLLANCPLPDDTLKEVLPLCIPQACEQVLENLTKIQMGNVTCYEMALKCAQENPQLTARYIDRLALSETQQHALRGFCRLCQYARENPAELFRLLANVHLPDDTLKKILPLCIPKACEQVLENLAKIQMGNATRFEMALKCAQENPQLTARYIDRLALTETQQLELREFCKFMK